MNSGFLSVVRCTQQRLEQWKHSAGGPTPCTCSEYEYSCCGSCAAAAAVYTLCLQLLSDPKQLLGVTEIPGILGQLLHVFGRLWQLLGTQESYMGLHATARGTMKATVQHS